MNWKIVLSFFVGAGAGVAGSAYFFNKYYEARFYEDVEEVRKQYEEDYMREVEAQINDIDKTIKAYDSKSADDTVIFSAKAQTPAKQVTDYTQFLHKDLDEDDEEMTSKGEALTREMAAERQQVPNVVKISPNDYNSRPAYDAMDLRYYTEDGSIVLDEETPEGERKIDLDEVKDYLGDALTEYGFISNNDEVIYLRNYKRTTDYRILKIVGRYTG